MAAGPSGRTLVGPDGKKLASGQVGISVVPPELVDGMLPPGVLKHTFDITVQAPGIATFSTPAPMTFPNVFNAAPGTQLDFLSFDHTTGRLVIEGTATVSADGQSVKTDPGTGITHPGWHGLTPPGVCGGPSGPPAKPPPPTPQDTTENKPPDPLPLITGETGNLSLTFAAPPGPPRPAPRQGLARRHVSNSLLVVSGYRHVPGKVTLDVQEAGKQPLRHHDRIAMFLALFMCQEVADLT